MKTGKKDLLAEAIADAQAVKDTALKNAKLALEESFTPSLESLVSSKISEEFDDEDEEELDIEEESVNEEDDEYMDDEEEDMDEDVNEEDADMDGEEDEYEDDEEESDLDLEAVLAELEGEDEEEMDMDDEEEDMDVDDLDIEEVIRAIKEMDGEEEDEYMDDEDDVDESAERIAELEGELKEAHNTIESIRSTLSEVNLLNSKLLYTNRLFRKFELSEAQKVKILENFDRASTTREAKLVYATLAENYGEKAKSRKSTIKEGLASKPSKSTKPKTEIVDDATEQIKSQFKYLAGIK